MRARTGVHGVQVVITVSFIFAIGSLLTISMIVPAMYSHVQHVGSYADTDVDYCDVRV